MPKDNIERILKKAEGGDGDNYDEIRYTKVMGRAALR